ncbi:MAG: hypothetical protein A3G24_06375 [Betaproteobacteria bacterium RIFCSPLOWO2_12_FULL_62_13]|nr:MAG: hypothetical protein A3G24_06375 [Betaproteobacteria bacterium RIFCSPLOWO2_12_FULL_62_13]
MNFHQIESVCEIVKQRFNMSEAALALNRSQPALSRQIAQLEKDLGVRVFSRTRNKIVGLTPEGGEVYTIGQRIAREVEQLRHVVSGAAEGNPELRIATTHTHARYSLPKVIKRFNEQSPKVLLNLRQGGDPLQCCQLVADGEADVGITTDIERLPRESVAIPAFKLSRCVLAPRTHPVTREKLTLQKIAQYPIIAYSRPPGGRWVFDSAFAEAGLRPRIAMSAIDADVSKTYIALGLGIAVLASIAYDPEQDRNLIALNADHLFRPGLIVLVFRRGAYVSRHTYAFLSLFAPHIPPVLIRRWVDGQETDRAQLIRTVPTAKFL